MGGCFFNKYTRIFFGRIFIKTGFRKRFSVRNFLCRGCKMEKWYPQQENMDNSPLEHLSLGSTPMLISNHFYVGYLILVPIEGGYLDLNEDVDDLPPL
jgi:hypothetical protein